MQQGTADENDMCWWLTDDNMGHATLTSCHVRCNKNITTKSTAWILFLQWKVDANSLSGEHNTKHYLRLGRSFYLVI